MERKYLDTGTGVYVREYYHVEHSKNTPKVHQTSNMQGYAPANLRGQALRRQPGLLRTLPYSGESNLYQAIPEHTQRHSRRTYTNREIGMARPGLTPYRCINRPSLLLSSAVFLRTSYEYLQIRST